MNMTQRRYINNRINEMTADAIREMNAARTARAEEAHELVQTLRDELASIPERPTVVLTADGKRALQQMVAGHNLHWGRVSIGIGDGAELRYKSPEARKLQRRIKTLSKKCDELRDSLYHEDYYDEIRIAAQKAKDEAMVGTDGLAVLKKFSAQLKDLV